MTHDEIRAALRSLMHQTGCLKFDPGNLEPEDFRIFHAAHGTIVWDFQDAIAMREAEHMHGLR